MEDLLKYKLLGLSPEFVILEVLVEVKNLHSNKFSDDANVLIG